MPQPVLVVEDHHDLRKAILATLNRAHRPCIGAASPADAIRRLQEGSYSAIVIDATLPLADDPVMIFLREKQPAELQKVVLIGEDEFPAGTQAARFPMIRKPFNSSELVASLPSTNNP